MADTGPSPRAHMSGNKLGIHPSRVDDGKPGNECNESEVADPGGETPMPSQPPDPSIVARFHPCDTSERS
jgi:hypothetical protein